MNATVVATPAQSCAVVRGWAGAAAVYFLAVLHRTSLGVAALAAEHRFAITPAQLSVFVLLQIGVYAAMQIPTGVLVDRYGPRRILVVAALIMGSAQLAFAVVPSYPAALLARALLGCGDALTFVSVLRFAAAHFAPRRYPMIVALTALAGMLGNVFATLPLAAMLRQVGWAPTFAVVGLLSLVSAVGVWRMLPDSTPAPRATRQRVAIRVAVAAVNERVLRAWSLPGTRLGFWVHFATMSSTTAFGVLWGYQYLIQGAGFTSSQAAGVLMFSVVVAAVGSLLVGALIGRRPVLRVPLALGVCIATVGGWTVLLGGYSGAPPNLLVVIQFAVMALGGPASMVGFALARDYNGSGAVGTASGVVNVGGFLATIVIALGIGWVLDAMGATDAHTFRIAVLVAVAVQLGGAVQICIWWLRVRASSLRTQARGGQVPVPVVRRRWDFAA